MKRRRLFDKLFAFTCRTAAWLALLLLAILLFDIAKDGLSHLNWQFLTSFPSRFPEKAGLKAAWVGSLWLIILTALIAIPLGVGAAIYLQEFAPKNRLSRFIELNIANLAGVPSIVYGMLGLTIFVRTLNFGRSVLAGAATMAILILPVIIITAQEAIKAVPNSLRYAALALGASRWQTVQAQVLPVALPWICTGVILAISRAIGETAPLIMIGALTYVAFTPQHPLDAFTALPIQVYNWASRPQVGFHHLAAAGILVLLIVLLTLNALAIYLRRHYEKKLTW